jgi:hypothetical protein
MSKTDNTIQYVYSLDYCTNKKNPNGVSQAGESLGDRLGNMCDRVHHHEPAAKRGAAERVEGQAGGEELGRGAAGGSCGRPWAPLPGRDGSEGAVCVELVHARRHDRVGTKEEAGAVRTLTTRRRRVMVGTSGRSPSVSRAKTPARCVV